ncbi:MAG: hypothetical protein GC178_04470 [Flavobacteriales bacterium]|nr:hypothetical protein [Flavobacteriales bacterium]
MNTSIAFRITIVLPLLGISLITLQGCFKDKNATQEVCNNTCQYAYDGECDDGGPNSLTSLCDCGTDCADCGTREKSDNDCLDGSSSSSSSSSSGSSSSSSGGGYSISDLNGFWTSPSGAIDGNDWFLYLCDNGLFVFKEYNPVGELQFNQNGNWSVSGSNLYLTGSNNWTFTVQSLNTVDGILVLSTNGHQSTFTLGGLDPCQTTGSSSSSSGSSSGGSSSSSSSGGPVSCGSSVTDIDGNTYQVVQIGNQCWMKSNLRTKHFRDGSAIPEGSPCNIVGENAWAGFAGAYWCYPGCDASNLSRDGLLYTAQVMTDARGICPNGWHVPTRTEYKELIDYIDNGTVGTVSWNIAIPKLKATSGWYGEDIGGGTGTYYNNGTNSTGFTAYPATQVTDYGVGSDGLHGYWHLIDDINAGNMGTLHMEAVPQWLLNGSNYTEGSFEQAGETASCRCVKD